MAVGFLLYRSSGSVSIPFAMEDNTMAKGQVRGNKETRKPKKDKAAKAPPATVPGKFAAAQDKDGKKK